MQILNACVQIYMNKKNNVCMYVYICMYMYKICDKFIFIVTLISRKLIALSNVS